MRLEDDYGLLVARTHRALRSRFSRELSKHGITFEQYQTLLGLSEGDGVPQRVLAERLALEPTYTARMLRRVEKAGLIERRRDQKDARVRFVFCTAKGQAVWEMARQIREQTLPQSVSCLTDAERLQLRHLLNTLHDHVTALMEQPAELESA
jgi:MarR family transcriptional regulator for hemolysin